MNITQAIQLLIAGNDLSREQMTAVMRQIMTGEATDAQIGGFLVGLSAKGETIDEIAAAATVMRELSTKVELAPEGLIDTCGTGGSKSGVFNVSTASAMVIAAAGGRVAKHGNRSITSKSGSADLLEAAGVKLGIPPEGVAECVNKVGVGFMFAQAHHSAMRHAITARKELAGIRTVFNCLGPLTNPAAAPNQVIGVFADDLLHTFAEVLRELGSEQVLVVRSEDGLDEFSIAAPSKVVQLKGGEISEYSVDPSAYDVAGNLDDVVVETAEQSLALINAAFAGEQTAAANMIALNAGAALMVLGIADDLAGGIRIAREVMSNGNAAAVLKGLAEVSQQY
jgi:anthranilate phosphoribosyltransferase